MLDHFTQRCAIWCYTVQLHAEVYVILGCTVWMYAKLFQVELLFYVTMYNLTEYYTISSKADSFDLTLNCFAQLCAILCPAIPSAIL